MRAIQREAGEAQRDLLGLARRDSEAFDAVLQARRLPQSTPAEQARRDAAIAAAELEAARVPLQTADLCHRVIGLAERAARQGNVNAISDAGVAGLLAGAAAEGALLNVEINLKSLPGSADKTDVEMRLHDLRARVAESSRRCREVVHAALSA
jgi:glutamate formiminotransferase/formiminotetrahydrofolate cyclodeaminase